MGKRERQRYRGGTHMSEQRDREKEGRKGRVRKKERE